MVRFKAQYEALPEGNILAEDSTWETVEARLIEPENADKLKKVTEELQNGGGLYAVMEDGSLEFIDDNTATPPMFVKNNKTGELRIIFNRDEQEMTGAGAQIKKGTHQWASITEMLAQAKKDGFEVFEADTKDRLGFGKEMQLAEAASPNKLFVGKQGGSWLATALKDARDARFGPDYGYVRVDGPYPRDRIDFLGLVRRLSV